MVNKFKRRSLKRSFPTSDWLGGAIRRGTKRIQGGLKSLLAEDTSGNRSTIVQLWRLCSIDRIVTIGRARGNRMLRSWTNYGKVQGLENLI